MTNKKLFVVFWLVVVLAMMIHAGGKAEQVKEPPVSIAEASAKYRESPMLTKMVKQNEILSVEQRLPNEPLVLNTYQGKIGLYGGTMRVRVLGEMPMGGWGENCTIRYERLVRLSPNFGSNRTYQFEPLIADWWKISPDDKEFTFHIREGMKWSDGKPLTSEDMKFYWEDVMGDDKIRATMKNITYFDGKLEIIDSNTFKVSFKDPRGTFLFDQATFYDPNPRWLEFPAHYLKQFHPKYISQDKLKEKMTQFKMDTYELLFKNRASWWYNPACPQIGPWVLVTEADPEGITRWARNPYYYKVDTEGNQLPYIDELIGFPQYDTEVAVLKQQQGEFDFSYRYWRVAQYPILKQGENKGHYKVGREVNLKASTISIMINQTTTDPVLRNIFQDFRFRRAVSHAINRQEIVDVVLHGAATPGAMHVGKYVAFYRSEWKELYAKYDVKLANSLLDEMGLKWNAKKDVRLRPDGKPLEIVMESTTASYMQPFKDAHQLIAEYMGAIGIRLTINASEFNLFLKRANSHDAHWTTEENFIDEMNSTCFIPRGSSNWGMKWGDWYRSKGSQGEEPLEKLKKVFKLRDSALTASTIEERNKLLEEACDIFFRELYIIGVAGFEPRMSTIHNRLRNVPPTEIFEEIVDPALSCYPPNVLLPEQWWIDPNWKP